MGNLLNQSFATDNFRKIFDYENRKGHYLEGKFFPEIEKITQNLKKCSFTFRDLKKNRSKILPEQYEEEKAKINKKKSDLKEQKESLLILELDKISANILNKNFRITLKEVVTRNGKKAYTISDDPASYFAIKQIQHNIRKLYKTQQGNRYNIVCQLRSLLNDSFPKYIVRTDIEKFYESIPRDSLFKKINEEPLLAVASKRIIQQVLTSYNKLSGSDIGLPRGIGISAYLSEIHMRDFDKKIKSNPEIIFYARYVDDIVAVFAPKPNSDTTGLLSQMEDEAKKSGLALNPLKTKELDLRSAKTEVLDYLGYKFCFGADHSMQIIMGAAKIAKYENKVNLTFDAYKNGSVTNEKAARKILVKRLKFLTGNTKLLNNKKDALVGIYFSNSLITDESCLDPLDQHLSQKISAISCDELKKRLVGMSFKDGFLQKRFTKFSAADLAKIVEVWKRAA
jgi:hypothetical protein